MRTLVSLVILGLLAAAHGGPARADIATDLAERQPMTLYWVEGNQLVQGRCSGPQITITREGCSHDRVRADFAEFYATLAYNVDRDLKRIEGNVRTLYSTLTAIDQRRLENMSVTPSDDVDELRADIAALDERIEPLILTLADLDAQIAAAVARLEAGDSDVVALLDALRQRRADASRPVEDLQAQIEAKRQQIIAAAATIFDPEVDAGLIEQRRDYAARLTTERSRLDAAITAAADLNRTFAMLKAPAPAYELRLASSSFARLRPLVKRFEATTIWLTEMDPFASGARWEDPIYIKDQRAGTFDVERPEWVGQPIGLLQLDLSLNAYFVSLSCRIVYLPVGRPAGLIYASAFEQSVVLIDLSSTPTSETTSPDGVRRLEFVVDHELGRTAGRPEIDGLFQPLTENSSPVLLWQPATFGDRLLDPSCEGGFRPLAPIPDP
jgi:hypothetical protein